MTRYKDLWAEEEERRIEAEKRFAIYERIHANAASRDFLAAALRVIERNDFTQEFVDEFGKPEMKQKAPTHAPSDIAYLLTEEGACEVLKHRAADYIEAMGGGVAIPRNVLEWWLQLAKDNPSDLIPCIEDMLAASPTPPAADNVWRHMDTAPRVEGEPILLLSRTHGVVEARWAPGEWSSEIPGISPREYSGPVWVCGDDAWQIEVEETPIGYMDGDAIGWLPRNALPIPPADGKGAN